MVATATWWSMRLSAPCATRSRARSILALRKCKEASSRDGSVCESLGMLENLETHFESPPPDWDETVCRLDGSIYQSAAWADYEKRRSGARAIYLLARDPAGEAAAGTLAFLHQSKHPLIS